MQTTFSCPTCGNDTWTPVESYLYLRDDLAQRKYTRHSGLRRKLHIAGRALLIARPRRGLIHYDTLSSYHRLRREVLFNVWFPGQERVQLDSVYCSVCGFACYTPRPDDSDIASKYAWLKRHEPDVGGQTGLQQDALHMDSMRAARIYGKCTAYRHGAQLDVLDYGGGNGKLMVPFVEHGHRCHLIDYNDNPLPGITKLCNDINEFHSDARFDVIICSHVLEHVSNVAGLVGRLRELLKPGGIIYAEVPQEIWAGLRIDADPVTHINYFTRNSFVNLFLANGFEVAEHHQQVSSYASTHMEVVWVVARAGSGTDASLLPADTRSMLYPSRLYSAAKLYRLLVEPKLRGLPGRLRR